MLCSGELEGSSCLLGVPMFEVSNHSENRLGMKCKVEYEGKGVKEVKSCGKDFILVS